MTQIIFYSNPNTISNVRNFELFEAATEIRIDAITLVILFNTYNLVRKLWGLPSRQKILRRSFDFTSDAKTLLEEWDNNSDEVFFIGGAKQEVIKFKKYIIKSHPNLKLRTYDGYAKSARTELVANLTKGSKLVVGLGAPRQEQLAITIAQLNLCSHIYTCGAFISQTAQAGTTYYPAYINRLHLRWLWRVWHEPHVFKRILLFYPKGFYLSAKFYQRFKSKIR